MEYTILAGLYCDNLEYCSKLEIENHIHYKCLVFYQNVDLTILKLKKGVTYIHSKLKKREKTKISKNSMVKSNGKKRRNMGLVLEQIVGAGSLKVQKLIHSSRSTS